MALQAVLSRAPACFPAPQHTNKLTPVVSRHINAVPRRTGSRRCPIVAGLAGAPGERLPSAWVAECLERAQHAARLIDGKHYIPVSEAQRWFEAGVHEGDTEFSQRLDAVMAERARLQGEMRVMAEAALKEHDEHENSMRRLLEYALALEREVEQARREMQDTVAEAAHVAQERLAREYGQALLDYEQAVEVEQHAVEASLRGQVTHLEHALKAAHEAKKQWRERALQAEQQFGQLRGLIENSLSQTTDAAMRRQQASQASQAQALPHTAVHLRASEELAPADADVSVQHQHSTPPAQPAPAPAPLHAQAQGKKNRRATGQVGADVHSA